VTTSNSDQAYSPESHQRVCSAHKVGNVVDSMFDCQGIKMKRGSALMWEMIAEDSHTAEFVIGSRC
jgi:hypothetical protein